MPTIARPQLRSVCRALFEQTATAGRVDRDAGVIYGVKCLGYESQNGRRYAPDGVSPQLYEGADVNIAHPGADGRRSDGTGSRFGRLVNARRGVGGIYADLHYLKAHPMAERICEAAERMPQAYGLSHVVDDGDYDADPSGKLITRVYRVDAVDIVADPATTNGLFESRRPSALEERRRLDGYANDSFGRATRRPLEEQRRPEEFDSFGQATRLPVQTTPPARYRDDDSFSRATRY